MRVGAFLPFSVDARSLVLNEAGGLGQAAIGSDRQNAHAAAAVIRRQYMLALAINYEVTRPRAPGGVPVQQSAFATFRVDGESTDGSAALVFGVVELAHRIKEMPAGMNGEEGGIDRFGGDLRIRKPA